MKPPSASREDTSDGQQPADRDATMISAGRAREPVVATTMEEIGRALEGRSLGPYRLERFVGGGGMGAVFRAIDTTLDRIVAVKVLSRHQSSDADMLRRFKNEAQSAARLDHENIGRVHAVGSDDGWHYIVFEFIEGTNLRDLVAERGPLDVPRAILFTVQVAEALQHASERDVVHRDIKPSNIIITPAGRARLVDMGLARVPAISDAHDLTASGMTLGTFDYISPEQARDPRAADVRSDLYSLGCTLFYMLAGRPPFADGTLVQKLLQHQQTDPPHIVDIRTDVPPGLADALGKLMQKSPQDRHQQPVDLIKDLVVVANDLGIDIDAEMSDPSPQPTVVHGPRPSPLPWLLPVLGLVAVVAGLWGIRAARQPWRAAPEREDVLGHADAGSGSALPTGGAGAPVGSRGLRVVDVPLVEGDVATLAEALELAGDFDVIELAFSTARDQPPLVVVGKKITLRATVGYEPVLRLGGADGGQGGAAVTVLSGGIVIDGVSLRSDAVRTGEGVLCALSPGADLTCRDAVIEMGRGSEGTAVASDAACIQAGGETSLGAGTTAGSTEPRRCTVRMERTVVIGEGTFLRAAADLDLVWSGGRCVTAGRFLAIGGSPRGLAGTTVRLALDEALFANRDGFATLVDSPALPSLPHLLVRAAGCRFLAPPGSVFLEQAGISQPDDYRTAIDWLDEGSRYEGMGGFRRIDGAAEREEISFSAVSQPLRYEPAIPGWQEGEPWDFRSR